MYETYDEHEKNTQEIAYFFKCKNTRTYFQSFFKEKISDFWKKRSIFGLKKLPIFSEGFSEKVFHEENDHFLSLKGEQPGRFFLLHRILKKIFFQPSAKPVI